MRHYLILLIFVSISQFFLSCNSNKTVNDNKNRTIDSSYYQLKNPILPGYHANPSVVEFEGHYYMYTTIDPWGGYELAVWESVNLQEWTFRQINWPSKAACTSPSSSDYLVGAPSVVKTEEDKFYMYVTVGSEIWVGKSDHPLGPWYNLLPDETPLISAIPDQGIRNTGAKCFIDDDKQSYLYWTESNDKGNHKCLVASLGNDMNSFSSEPNDITPSDYYGTPNVFRKSGRFFMLYSQGDFIHSNYKLRSAYSTSPLDPWMEKDTNSVLLDSPDSLIVGPGHSAVLQLDSQYFLLYQRNISSEKFPLLRQICCDRILFDKDNYIIPVKASYEGVRIPTTDAKIPQKFTIVGVSSELSEKYPASAAVDNHPGSLWIPAVDDKYPSIIIDLRERKQIMNVYLWMEHSIVIYQYLIEYSSDKKDWKVFSDKLNSQEIGAPRFHTNPTKARYLRISFNMDKVPYYRPAIWEIKVD